MASSYSLSLRQSSHVKSSAGTPGAGRVTRISAFIEFDFQALNQLASYRWLEVGWLRSRDIGVRSLGVARGREGYDLVKSVRGIKCTVTVILGVRRPATSNSNPAGVAADASDRLQARRKSSM
jgi:hypothetical protein